MTRRDIFKVAIACIGLPEISKSESKHKFWIPPEGQPLTIRILPSKWDLEFEKLKQDLVELCEDRFDTFNGCDNDRKFLITDLSTILELCRMSRLLRDYKVICDPTLYYDQQFSKLRTTIYIQRSLSISFIVLNIGDPEWVSNQKYVNYF